MKRLTVILQHNMKKDAMHNQKQMDKRISTKVNWFVSDWWKWNIMLVSHTEMLCTYKKRDCFVKGIDYFLLFKVIWFSSRISKLLLMTLWAMFNVTEVKSYCFSHWFSWLFAMCQVWICASMNHTASRPLRYFIKLVSLFTVYYHSKV